MCPRRDIHVLIFLGEHRCRPKTHHVPPGVHDGYYFFPTCGLGLYIVLFVSFIPLHYIAHCEFCACRPQLTISFDVFLPSFVSTTTSLLSQHLWRTKISEGKTSFSSAFGIAAGVTEVHTTTARSKGPDESRNDFLDASSSLLCSQGDRSNMVTFVKAQAYAAAHALHDEIEAGSETYDALSVKEQKAVDHCRDNSKNTIRTKHSVAAQVFTEWPFRLRQQIASDSGGYSCVFIFFDIDFLNYVTLQVHLL